MAVLSVLAAACGDDGVALEDWVEQADEICAEAQEASDEHDISTPEDILDRGEEAFEESEDRLDELDELERPGGEDEERAEALIDGLETVVDIQEEILAEIGEGEDELAVLAVPRAFEDDVDEGLEAAEDVDADDCTTVLEERQQSLEEINSLFEQLGGLAEVRVEDCVASIDDFPLEVVDCGSDESEGRVVRTIVSGAVSCPDETELYTDRPLSLCIERFGPAPDADGVLELGSCITLTDGDEEGTVDITELGCDESGVTHTISGQVRGQATCPQGERQFAKSEDEIAESGRGEWCAEPT